MYIHVYSYQVWHHKWRHYLHNFDSCWWARQAFDGSLHSSYLTPFASTTGINTSYSEFIWLSRLQNLLQ